MDLTDINFDEDVEEEIIEKKMLVFNKFFSLFMSDISFKVVNISDLWRIVEKFLAQPRTDKLKGIKCSCYFTYLSCSSTLLVVSHVYLTLPASIFLFLLWSQPSENY